MEQDYDHYDDEYYKDETIEERINRQHKEMHSILRDIGELVNCVCVEDRKEHFFFALMKVKECLFAIDPRTPLNKELEGTKR